MAYAGTLFRNGDGELGLQWLREQIDRKPRPNSKQRPNPGHLQRLRRTYGERLRSTGAAARYLKFVTEWATAEAQTDPQQETLERLLGAYWLANQVDPANKLAQKWIDEGLQTPNMTDLQRVRLRAGLRYALGNRYQIYTPYRTMDSAWLKPLDKAARHFLAVRDEFEIARMILNAPSFTNSDESDRLRADLAKKLKDEVATLPGYVVSDYVDWTIGRPGISKTAWNRIRESLGQRWKKETNYQEIIARGLDKINRRYFATQHELPFLRERIRRAENEKNQSLASSLRQTLFDRLIARTWTQQHEDEALRMIASLGRTNDTDAERLRNRLHSLMQFVDNMLRRRQALDQQTLQDKGHPEKLTRSEWLQKRQDFRLAAQQGVVATLTKYLKAQLAANPTPNQTADKRAATTLLAWVRLEQQYLQLRLKQAAKPIAVQLLQQLDESPRLYH